MVGGNIRLRMVHVLITVKILYLYRFELETELNLADDAPITFVANGRDAVGSVLTCEGFEIIVTIDKDFGNKIGVAYISVEPWKSFRSTG